MNEAKDVGMLVVRLLALLVYTIYCTLENLVKTLLPRKYRRKDIRGKIALVTGGASGIGRLVCIKLAKRGAVVVTWDVDEEGNKETARQTVAAGGQCRAYVVDLCDRHAIYAVAAKVKQEVGKVDILVNNAGIVTGKRLLDSSDESIVKTFQVNIISHFWTSKAFLADMIARDAGHIVTIASMAGKFPSNSLIDYCSSKYAAVGFHDSLCIELKVEGKKGIHTTVVCPALVQTTLFKGAHYRYFPILKPDWVAEEIVDAILMNTNVLILPWHLVFMVLMKEMMPEKAFFQFCKITSLTNLMDTFVAKRDS